jgi:diguanylate cyclase (GGDEF)-like protein
VLIANEQEWTARSLESLLAPNGYAVLRAYTGRRAMELAWTAQPDAILIDAQLPDMDGMDLCRQLRDDSMFGASTPIIVTTRTGDRAERLAAYGAGAWDYCSEPLDGEVLLLKLQSWVRSKRHADDLREACLLDQLTGFYNMRGLARRAREIGAEAYRRRGPLACVAFSPRGQIPGEHESAEGQVTNRLVRHLGAICRDTRRISDVFGRLGPTEFAVVAPATDEEGAVRLMERLQAAIDERPLPDEISESRLAIRAGYCAVPNYADSSVDAVDMLVRATTALRQLRTSGAHVWIKPFDAS